MLNYDTILLQMTIMSRKQAYISFFASYCCKIHEIIDPDIFQIKIRIPDKNNLFATLWECVEWLLIKNFGIAEKA